MSRRFKIGMFVHSMISDWNHGNVHFLRGLARALVHMGHDVKCFEELGSWSLTSLVRMEGEAAIEAIDGFRREYPELAVHFYKEDAGFDEFAEEHLRGLDIVIIHEWNEPALVNKVLALKQAFGFKALLHDTHHRVYSNAGEMLRFHLHLFDGVLAFGEVIRKIYSDGLGMPNVHTLHEAADVDSFKPTPGLKTMDILWIGNWGDEERTRELQEFLIQPARTMPQRRIVAHGVRYPASVQERFREVGIDYRGYLPNLKVPAVYGESLVALHIPRRQYANGLAGIPTIRVFEALACAIPLVCAPWQDAENLFRPGEDYVVVRNGEEMKAELEHLLRDPGARRQIAESGLETILRRHTCRHRAEQLVEICGELSK